MLQSGLVRSKKSLVRNYDKRIYKNNEHK